MLPSDSTSISLARRLRNDGIAPPLHLDLFPLMLLPAESPLPLWTRLVLQSGCKSDGIPYLAAIRDWSLYAAFVPTHPTTIHPSTGCPLRSVGKRGRDALEVALWRIEYGEVNFESTGENYRRFCFFCASGQFHLRALQLSPVLCCVCRYECAGCCGNVIFRRANSDPSRQLLQGKG